MINRREKLRQATIDEIKEIAWDMLKKDQPVTLRTITTQMGMTAPAFYTYFKNRDDLMAALVEDALASFYNHLSTPFPKDGNTDICKKIHQVFMRYREWAIAHPAAFSLFAGQPVSGFSGRHESVRQKAGLGYELIVDLFYAADQEGLLKKEDIQGLESDYDAQLSQIRAGLNTRLDLPGIHLVIRMVSLVHGLISLELSQRFDGIAGRLEPIFSAQVASALAAAGLTPKK